MLLASLVNHHNNKYYQRNIQSSLSRNNYGKTNFNKMSVYLKNAKMIKSTETKRNNSYSLLQFNSGDKDKFSYLNNNKESKKTVKLSDISIQKGISNIFNNDKLYSSIMEKIEQIMIGFRNNKIKLYYILNKVDNYINNILNDSNSTKDKTSSNNNNSFNNFNMPIKDILETKKEEIEINNYKKKINKLIQKINEIENKFKIERLNYLFCIGENQKRILNLEKKLNMTSINKMTKNELKKYICYPNYVKFEVTDEINPKSIPMYLSKKHKSKSPKTFKKIESMFKTDLKNAENIFNNINEKENSNSALNNAKIDDINENDLNINNNENEEKNNEFQIDNEIESKDFNKILELGKISFEKYISSVNKFNIKDKNYFISHPKLNYIKDINSGNKITSWKLGNQINSLPKQLSKLKTISKSQKNAIIVFPSFLNETLLNIEKLKNNKNFRSIENKFEDLSKKKVKHND